MRRWTCFLVPESKGPSKTAEQLCALSSIGKKGVRIEKGDRWVTPVGQLEIGAHPLNWSKERRLESPALSQDYIHKSPCNLRILRCAVRCTE